MCGGIEEETKQHLCVATRGLGDSGSSIEAAHWRWSQFEVPDWLSVMSSASTPSRVGLSQSGLCHAASRIQNVFSFARQNGPYPVEDPATVRNSGEATSVADGYMND